MSVLNVGGINPLKRYKTFPEALAKAKPDDVIMLHKKVTISSVIDKHVIIDGNNNEVTVESGQAGFICNTSAIIKNVKFKIGSRSNAIVLNNGGILENVSISFQSPVHEFYPSIMHKHGKLMISNSNLQMLSTMDETQTEIVDTVFSDYYGRQFEISSFDNLSTLMGRVTIKRSEISMVMFAGDVQVIESTIGQFNVNRNILRIHASVFSPLPINNKLNMKKEPSHGPLSNKDDETKYLLQSSGEVYVDQYQTAETDDFVSLFITQGLLDVINVNNDDPQGYHIVRNATLSFTDTNDSAYYDVSDSTISQVNSNVRTSQKVETAMDKLNGLIGLQSVKQSVTNIMNTIKVNQDTNNKDFAFSYHMVFAGDPGTGKTTVAKIVAQALFEIGAVSQNKLTEVTVDKLIKGYVGQTAANVREILDGALGGVLFIDEAYELSVKDGVNSFNSEALSVIIRYMEDHRDDLVVIAAGYTKEMKQFIASNIGLQRRFQWIDFEDYSAQEMADIFNLMRTSHEKEYEDVELNNAIPQLFAKLIDIYLSKPDANGRITKGGNGGLARNVYQQVIQSQNNRIVSNVDETRHITKGDLMAGFKAEMEKALKI